MRLNINSTRITAADDDSSKLTLEEILDEKQDALEDDFDYLLASVDKLVREGMPDVAISIVDSISDSLQDILAEALEDMNTGIDEDEV